MKHAHVAHARNLPNLCKRIRRVTRVIWAPAYLEDNLGPKRGPPQRDGTKTGEEAYERAVVPDIECEAMGRFLESIC
jgi:hypothetical protein